ncbi:MAG: NUDIX domain-containing protein [Acholeplasmataceae bacterium]
MKKIGPSLIESGFDLSAPYLKRQTVRAIILNDNKDVFMLYSKIFDDYTFPGGGIKADEDDDKALKRELKEELGANITEEITPYGYTEEFKFGFGKIKKQYQQISSYYIVKADMNDTPTFNTREKTQALKSMWVDINVAIKQNDKAMQNSMHQKPGLKTVLLRENLVLNNLKEHKSHETI